MIYEISALCNSCGNGRAGVIASRRDGVTLEYGNPVFIWADDALRRDWRSIEIPTPTTDYDVNFHGAMIEWPTSVGGADVTGWVAYSYGKGRIAAFYTADNGATWTIKPDCALPDGTPGVGITNAFQSAL